MFALLLPISKKELAAGIADLMDVLAVHPETGDLLTFPSLSDADHFRESNLIDCKVISLFIKD